MDLGVTYKGLDNQASDMSANLNGAAAEARIKPLAIQEQLKVELGKFGAELHDNGKTDTGLSANNGATGMFGKAIGAIAVTAGVTAIAGPAVGGAVGFGLAIKDAVQSIAKAPQADAVSGYYTLKRSMQEFQEPDAEQYANPEEDPICQNYQAACDGVNYNYGFATAAPAAMSVEALLARKMDTAEQRHAQSRIGALQSKLGEHENTLDTVAHLAPKNGVVVAEGPKAPVGMGTPVFAP